jgi:transcriptional regulator with XRE-family HTH domain
MAVWGQRPDDPTMVNFGANLRKARKACGLTQEQVSERSGVQAGEISRIEAGKRDPKVSTLLRLAEAVETPPGKLLD